MKKEDVIIAATEKLGQVHKPLPEIGDIARAITEALGGAEQLGQEFFLLYKNKDTSAATKTRMFEAYLRLLTMSVTREDKSEAMAHKTKEEIEATIYGIVKKLQDKDAADGTQPAPVDEAANDQGGEWSEGAEVAAGPAAPAADEF